jgi:NADH-quinone oxidoreductase subunit N
MLFGMALIYAATGSLGFLDISVSTGSLFYLGLLMLFVGAAFKLSLVPFHLWTPDVYQGGPLPAVAFLATLGKVAVAVFAIRLFSQPQIGQLPVVTSVIALVAVASILVGNLLALRQTNLKRLLAYSSIAHMGYLLVAVLSISAATAITEVEDSAFALESALFYLLVYSLLSLGAFGCALLVSSSEDEAAGVGDYRGLFWRSPWLASVLLVMVLGLAGIPLTAGFIAKFQVFFAAVGDSQWGLLAAMVLGSAIGLFYYLRIVYQMLMPVLDTEESFALREIGIESLGVLAVLAVLTVVVLWVGVYPEPLFALIAFAASNF